MFLQTADRGQSLVVGQVEGLNLFELSQFLDMFKIAFITVEILHIQTGLNPFQ